MARENHPATSTVEGACCRHGTAPVRSAIGSTTRAGHRVHVEGRRAILSRDELARALLTRFGRRQFLVGEIMPTLANASLTADACSAEFTTRQSSSWSSRNIRGAGGADRR